MKTHAILFLALTSVLTAQDKPTDPFLKDKQAPAATPVAAPDAIKNLSFFIETITLPQADYAALLDSPTDRVKLHERALAAVKAGTAKLDGCHLITTKSGMSCLSVGVDELIYPTEWARADRAGLQYPAAFEMRPLGDRFEIEGILSPDGEKGPIDLVHSFNRDLFRGMRTFKADTKLVGLPVADFIEQQGASSCTMIPGVPFLLSTFASQGSITLVFSTARAIGVADSSQVTAKGIWNIQMNARVISLERMQGWELLKKHSQGGAALFAEVKLLLASKAATLEHASTIITKSGTNAVMRSGPLYSYGIEFDPPTEGKPAEPSNDPKIPSKPDIAPDAASTRNFERRSLGFHWEVQPTLSADRALCDYVISFSNCVMSGNLKDKNWNEHYPEIPLFSIQKITTASTQAIGTTTLLGTLNPPGETGVNEHQDSGRIWLLFMTLDLE
jgi:hypothetical protein